MEMDFNRSINYLTFEVLPYHLEKNMDYHLSLLMKHTNNVLFQFESKFNSLAVLMANNSASNSFAVSNNSLRPSSTVESEIEQKVQTANSRIDMLQNNHQHMLNDVTRLLKVIENSKLENRILKDNLRDIKQMAQELHKTLAINQVSILALEERLVNLEKISYDGTLLWRINNVSERIQEAKSGNLK